MLTVVSCEFSHCSDISSFFLSPSRRFGFIYFGCSNSAPLAGFSPWQQQTRLICIAVLSTCPTSPNYRENMIYQKQSLYIKTCGSNVKPCQPVGASSEGRPVFMCEEIIRTVFKRHSKWENNINTSYFANPYPCSLLSGSHYVL